MSAVQAKFLVTTMACMLSVSKAGFYAWLQRSASSHAQADAALLKRVRTVRAIHAQLARVISAPSQLLQRAPSATRS